MVLADSDRVWDRYDLTVGYRYPTVKPAYCRIGPERRYESCNRSPGLAPWSEHSNSRFLCYVVRNKSSAKSKLRATIAISCLPLRAARLI